MGGLVVAQCVDALYQSYSVIKKKQIYVVKPHIRIFTAELFGQFCYVCVLQVVTEYFLDTHRDVETKKSNFVGYRQNIAERIG